MSSYIIVKLLTYNGFQIYQLKLELRNENIKNWKLYTNKSMQTDPIENGHINFQFAFNQIQTV